MILYLIRHGQAVDSAPSGADADRSLTLIGAEQAKALAAYLSNESSEHNAGVGVEVIASPYVRTHQTAAPIWEMLGQSEKVDDRLAAVSSVSQIIEVIGGSASESVAVISHNPIISRAIDVLVHGPEAPGMFSMAPGQLIALRVNRHNLIGSGELIGQYRMGD